MGETPRRYQRRWQAPDLSARLYEFKVPWLPFKTKLKLTLGPANDETSGIVFALEKNGGWRKLASFRNSTEVNDVNLLQNAGARFFLLVANGRAVGSYTGSHVVEVTVELAPVYAYVSGSTGIHVGVDGPYTCAVQPGANCNPPVPNTWTYNNPWQGTQPAVEWPATSFSVRRTYEDDTFRYEMTIAGLLSVTRRIPT